MDMGKQRELDMDRLIPHVEELSRLFDSVQVFVSRHDPTIEGTISLHAGVGNFHARRGQVAEWVLQQDEEARWRVQELVEDEEDEEDD